MKIKLSTIAILLTLGLTGAGCGSGLSGQRVAGFHGSSDAGLTWTPSNSIILDADTTDSLARYDITDLIADSLQPEILYAATKQAGLYKSENSGVSWTALTTKGQIQSISVSPHDSNLLAAARQNQIFLSVDGGAIWKLVYTDPGGIVLTTVTFDAKIKNKLYITSASGDLLSSRDLGETWSLLYQFNQPAISFVAHGQQDGLLYVLTTRPDVMSSNNGGLSWTSLTDSLDFSRSLATAVDFKVHPQNKDFLLFATQTAIYLSQDQGQNWQKLPLLTTDQPELIQSIAWDAKSVNVIYYATPTVFYRSTDKGKSWRTSIFSSNKLPKHLLVSAKDSNIIFIGTQN